MITAIELFMDKNINYELKFLIPIGVKHLHYGHGFFLSISKKPMLITCIPNLSGNKEV